MGKENLADVRGGPLVAIERERRVEEAQTGPLFDHIHVGDEFVARRRQQKLVIRVHGHER